MLDVTEVMVFAGTSVTPSVDLGSLARYTKRIVNDLGVKVNVDLKFDSQIKAVVKATAH